MFGESRFEAAIVDAVNRRGKPTKCRVTCMPILDKDGDHGVILMMEEQEQPLTFPSSPGGDGKG